MKKKYIFSIILLSFFSFFVCIFFGSVRISSVDIYKGLKQIIQNGFKMDPSNQVQVILMKIRLPRLLMAFFGGSVLSIVGLLMQSITKNPLAEPYVLGISSGASAGAVSAIILGWFSFFGSYNVYLASFIGAVIATLLIIVLQGSRQDTIRLVLLGMGVNAFFTALTTFLIYSSRNEAQVRSAMFWTIGSFSGVHYGDLVPVVISLILLLVFSHIIIKELDILLLGHKVAKNIGLNIVKLQISIIVVSALSTALLVSKVGVIGFIGLIIPHISRKIMGVKHKNLLWTCVFFGGMGLMITDTFARTLFAPNELPIGVMTGLIGAPVFIYILNSTRNGN